MLFNSIEYAIFLPIAFLCYWFVVNKNTTLQNFFILTISYIFYGWWDHRFLSLIIFSSFVDFFIGRTLLKKEKDRDRKILLGLSLAVNLGLLGVFKYYNFFIDSFQSLLSTVGANFNTYTLSIVLPVGISFYTFQTLSYTIDVYRKKIEPSKDIIAFFAYVSFFPQLVAGPIERAANLLPQFDKPRQFNATLAVDGVRQILWGLFKKVVVADNCAVLVNDIFANYETLPASVLLLGAIYFAFQIYGDFSGYSDIAIGTAKLFGFSLMTNFSYPYFSRNIAEFWRRWHISLSTWFRDYLYIPLGGSRVGTYKKIRNVMIIFVVSGFWHGANWTFLAWGALNGLYFIPSMLRKKNRKYMDIPAMGKLFPSLEEAFHISITFFITCIAWVFFRAESIGHAVGYLVNCLDTSLFTWPTDYLVYFPWILLLCTIDWLQRAKVHPADISHLNPIVRKIIYAAFVIIIFLFANNSEDLSFIYFQF